MTTSANLASSRSGRRATRRFTLNGPSTTRLNIGKQSVITNHTNMIQLSFIWEDSKTEIVQVTDCVSVLFVGAKSNSGVASLPRLMACREDAIDGHTSAGPFPVLTAILEGNILSTSAT